MFYFFFFFFFRFLFRPLFPLSLLFSSFMLFGIIMNWKMRVVVRYSLREGKEKEGRVRCAKLKLNGC